jgi:endoglucanase
MIGREGGSAASDAGSSIVADASSGTGDASATRADASTMPGRDGGGAGSEAGSQEAGRDAAGGADSATSDAGAPNNATGFVGEHGALQVKGNRVVDGHGNAIQLRGMSLFWSQWTDFYVAKNVDVMADDWKSTVVRAALGVENEGGYLQNQQANVAKVRAIVDRAIQRGVYVIIDWHDHNAPDHVAQATTFFQEMARAYGKQPHVIFEVFNEPLNVPWSSVKSYAEGMIRTIRGAGSQNLVIVGTPNWSQDVDAAANDRITADSNVAYTLHFYANTHKQPLRDKAKAALDRGAALFVTEWGTCSADGNGSINEAETRTWLSFLKENSISWANWSLHNKAEACSAVQASGASAGPWRDDQLTPSGRLVKSLIP